MCNNPILLITTKFQCLQSIEHSIGNHFSCDTIIITILCGCRFGKISMMTFNSSYMDRKVFIIQLSRYLSTSLFWTLSRNMKSSYFPIVNAFQNTVCQIRRHWHDVVCNALWSEVVSVSLTFFNIEWKSSFSTRTLTIKMRTLSRFTHFIDFIDQDTQRACGSWVVQTILRDRSAVILSGLSGIRLMKLRRIVQTLFRGSWVVNDGRTDRTSTYCWRKLEKLARHIAVIFVVSLWNLPSCQRIRGFPSVLRWIVLQFLTTFLLKVKLWTLWLAILEWYLNLKRCRWLMQYITNLSVDSDSSVRMNSITSVLQTDWMNDGLSYTSCERFLSEVLQDSQHVDGSVSNIGRDNWCGSRYPWSSSSLTSYSML